MATPLSRRGETSGTKWGGNAKYAMQERCRRRERGEEHTRCAGNDKLDKKEEPSVQPTNEVHRPREQEGGRGRKGECERSKRGRGRERERESVCVCVRERDRQREEKEHQAEAAKRKGQPSTKGTRGFTTRGSQGARGSLSVIHKQ